MRTDILDDPAIPIPIPVRVEYCLVFRHEKKGHIGTEVGFDRRTGLQASDEGAKPQNEVIEWTGGKRHPVPLLCKGIETVLMKKPRRGTGALGV